MPLVIVIIVTPPSNFDGTRIGDQERSDAIHTLGEHYTQGRLGFPEYEHRTREAAQATTFDQLRGLFQDLPAPWPANLLPAIPAAPTVAYYPVPVGPAAAQHMGYSDKSKIAAGLLQIFLPFGVGRLYTGHVGIGITQLLLFWLGIIPCGLGTVAAVIWCLVDGIVLLAGDSTDAYGRPLRS